MVKSSMGSHAWTASLNLAIRERWFALMGETLYMPVRKWRDPYIRNKNRFLCMVRVTPENLSHVLFQHCGKSGKCRFFSPKLTPVLAPTAGRLCLIRVIGTAIFHLRPVHYRDLSTATMIHGQWRQWPSSTRLLDLCLASACLGRCHTSYL